MAFLTGVMFLNAPAAALNNSGDPIPGSRTENTSATKFMRTKEGVFPYVSAQSFRYWLRSTLEREKTSGWTVSPIDREGKIAYTDGNPLDYWDDDLFGYMRAPGSSKEAVASRELRGTKLTPLTPKTTITRVSPLRVSTFVSIAIATPTSDFGTMSRHEGDPVPHEHQFYHTVMKGMFSLDLHAAGTFSYVNRTGYLNLDPIRIDKAKDAQLEHLKAEKSFRLSAAERQRRVSALLDGLASISGGAKQTLHYTDVTPAIVLAMVTRGGNNPLQYVVGADKDGRPKVNAAALTQAIEAWRDQILSPLYVGWVEGFCDEERATLAGLLGDPALGLPNGYMLAHPRQALQSAAKDFANAENAGWLA